MILTSEISPARANATRTRVENVDSRIETRETRIASSPGAPAPKIIPNTNFSMYYEEGIGGRPHHHQDRQRLGKAVSSSQRTSKANSFPSIRSVPGRATYDHTMHGRKARVYYRKHHSGSAPRNPLSLPQSLSRPTNPILTTYFVPRTK